MQFKINNKILLVLFILILSQFTYLVSADEHTTKLNQIEKLGFRQELTISLDTSLSQAKHYPVDIKISFDNPCWAKDNINRSIRLGYYKKNILTELESQIYNLEFIDKKHISSCSIVFITPEEADGSERYYVFYDEYETEPISYSNHIKLFETSYYYEPIQGQKIDFDCFQIEQDGEIVYVAIKNGEVFGYPFSNVVIRLKPGSREPRIEYLDQICDYSMDYGIPTFPGYIGTAYEKNPNVKIIVDGNLMVRFEIESVSPRNDLKTRNIYTYYFCPDETRRIFTDVNHEVLKDVQIDYPSTHDGSYAGLASLKARSKSISSLNIGDFFPMIALVDENNIVGRFNVPLDSRTSAKDLILTRQDNVYLGDSAWMCFYDSTNLKTHGIIFSSNKDIVKNSSDGLQVKAWVEENINLPGLKGGTSNLYVMRTSSKKGVDCEKTLSKGHTVNFQSLFISVEKQEYTVLEDESTIFQEWIKKTSFKDVSADTKESKEKRFYNITALVNLAPSTPLGVLLSAITGKNISFISAELYKEENFRSAGTVTRIPLRSINIDFQEANLKTIISLFDIKNSSFSKKIIFPDVEPGRYIIKIYRENPIFSNDKKFIGFQIVDFKDSDIKTRLICAPESKINCFVFDSSGNPIKDVNFYLKYKDSTIQKDSTNENGSVVISAPFILKENYILNAYYNGFLIAEEEINLKIKNIFLSLDKKYEVSLNSFLLHIKDLWGLPAEVDIKPFLTSDFMSKPVLITAEKIKDSSYFFENLPSADYVLEMNYKSLNFEKDFKIYEEETMNLVFPGQFKILMNFFNIVGEKSEEVIIKIQRAGITKTFSAKNAKEGFFIPPGMYTISVLSNNNIISKQLVVVHGDKDLDVYTAQGSFLHMFLTIIGIFIVFIWIYAVFFKNKKSLGLKLLTIALLIISLALPWWSLTGTNNSNSINTKTFLIPAKMINSYKYNNYIFGDASHAPQEFYMALAAVSFLILMSCFLVLLSIFLKKKSSKITIFTIFLVTMFLITAISVFFYTMSFATEYGLGSVIGEDTITTEVPWDSTSFSIYSKWGFDLGFYLIILVIGINLFYLIARKRLNF